MILRALPFALVTLGLVAADRFTKAIFMTRPSDGSSLFSSIVSLTHHQNFGIIANIPLPLPVILLMSAVVSSLLLIVFVRASQRHEFGIMLACAVAMAGAIGNTWDRIAWGYVFDWLLLFERSAINLADIYVGTGIGALLLLSRRPEMTVETNGEDLTRS